MMTKTNLSNMGIKSLVGFIKGFFSDLNQPSQMASPMPSTGLKSKYGDQATKLNMTMPNQDEWQPIKQEEVIQVNRNPQAQKQQVFNSASTTQKPAIKEEKNILASEDIGRSKVVQDAKRLYPDRYEAAKNLVKSKTDDPLLQDLIIDIAASENSLKGANTKNAEGSSASGFLQFTDPTWRDYERWIGEKKDKTDPGNQVEAALWLLTQKNLKGVSKLERWDASKGKWGSNYSPEEIQQFYMNANNNT